jgi:hypothetical protein
VVSTAVALGCVSEPDRQLVMTADNEAKVWIGDALQGEIRDWQRPLTLDLSPKQAKAVIAVEAHNVGGAAGLVGAVKYRDADSQVVEQPVNWVCSPQPETGWQRSDFDDSRWQSPGVVAAYGSNPWGNAAALDLERASWVWPSDPPAADETVYCRGRFAGPVAQK